MSEDRRDLVAALVCSPVIGAAIASPADARSAAIVSAPCGTLSGTANGDVRAFKGIPYGEAVSGPARFRPACPASPWRGVRKAAAFGPRCPQPVRPYPPYFAPFVGCEPMNEDCLTLNVWTGGTATRHRPVMVWLHGGGFATWSGAAPATDGTALAGTGHAVVVTLNHRLNLFGYLYLAGLGDPRFADASNVGMTDIVLALRWVRDNIAAFGGDAGNVTIFGESGGGAKVSALLAMPAAHGLFHKAIIQSGPLLRGVTPARATAAARAVLAALAIDDPAVLAAAPTDRLLEALADVAPTYDHAFAPVVDGATLPADPFDPVAPPGSADVPLLIGSNATEASAFFPPAALPTGWDGVAGMIRPLIGPLDPATIVERFRALMPGASPPELLYRLFTAISFELNGEALADRKAGQRAPVWRYELAWRTPAGGGGLGSPHTLDVPLVFGTTAAAAALTGGGEEAARMSRLMQPAWLAFAATGNPNAAGLPRWPRYAAGERATMRFDLSPTVARDPYAAERAVLADAPLFSIAG